MTIEEITKQIDALKSKIAVDLVRDVTKIISQDVVSLIETRVRDKQKDASGNSFSRYSTRPMLTSGVTTKSRRVWTAMAGSKRKRAQLDWVTIKKGGKNIKLFELKGGYAQMRKLEGFSNANKSFEFTGEMWRKFGVTRVNVTANGITITLGGKTQASQNKIDWNSEREGQNIIDISKQELAYLQKEVEKLLEGYIIDVKLN